MISENLPSVKGWIKVYAITKTGEKVLLEDRKNALVSNARKIIAHCLGADVTYALNQISVYKAGVLVSTTPSVTINYPTGDDKIRINGRFNESSFNDTIDEIKLESAGGGIFSQVGSLSILKTNTIQLEIEWVLTINNL